MIAVVLRPKRAYPTYLIVPFAGEKREQTLHYVFLLTCYFVGVGLYVGLESAAF